MIGRELFASIAAWTERKLSGPKDPPAAPSAVPVYHPTPEQVIARDQARFKSEFGSRWEKEFDRHVALQRAWALAHYRGEERAVVPAQKLEVGREFGADQKWEAAVMADADRVIAEIGEGRCAAMKEWDLVLVKVFNYDMFGPPGATVIDERRRRRAAVLAEAKRRLECFRQRESERRQEAEQEERRLRAVQRLANPVTLTGSSSGIVFGSDVADGEVFVLPVRQIQHMLVAGATGSGKSVFLHQIVWQLVKSAEVERLVLIDLKGGIEFDRYRESGKVKVVWEFADVVTVVEDLVRLMDDRQEEMRLKRQQNWPRGRVFVVVDEYAEIQSDIDTAETKEEKARAKRLAGNLVRIARRARSLGIVLVCALQKPTTDAMNSALRTNLNCRICLRVGSSQLAVSVLDEVDDLPVEPTRLPRGRYVYYDPSAGIRRYMQTHIAPGVDLGSAP